MKHSPERIQKIRDTAIKKFAKITWSKAQEIRDLYQTGKYTQLQLGDRFGLSHTQVGNIVSGKAWKQ